MDNQSRFFAATYTWIKDLFSPPVFEDEEKSRIARILGIILWAIVAVVGAMIFTWLATGKSDELGPYAFLANGVIIAVSIGLLFLIRRGHVKPAGLIFVDFFMGQYHLSSLYFRRCARIGRHYLYDDYGACRPFGGLENKYRVCGFKYNFRMDPGPC